LAVITTTSVVSGSVSRIVFFQHVEVLRRSDSDQLSIGFVQPQRVRVELVGSAAVELFEMAMGLGAAFFLVVSFGEHEGS